MKYDADGLSYYDGDWVDNIRQGFGTRRYSSGNTYEGMWYKNRRHGLGTMHWFDRNQSYTGIWEDGVQVTIVNVVHLIFRSTLHCRPNKAGLKYPSVRPSVRPSVHKKLLDFNEIWHVRRYAV